MKTDLGTIDPGIRGAGVALFDSMQKRLYRAAYVQNPCTQGDDLEACLSLGRAVSTWFRRHTTNPENLSKFIAEWPRIYRLAKLKGDPNDLPPLVGVDAATAAYLAPVVAERLFPEQWKGQVDADIMTDRILFRLLPEELAVLEPCPKRFRHNMIDAVGIGLHELGRLKPKRVYPGATL